MRDWTPLHAHWSGCPPVMIAVGEQETPPFHSQAEELATKLITAGVPTKRIVAAGENHMTVARSLGRSETAMAAALVKCIAQSRAEGV